jgi:cyclohexanecarboxylate-CoA ligase/acyl-CoA synthetase
LSGPVDLIFRGYWRAETLRDWLEARVRERPGHDALRQGGRRVSWAELARLVRAFERGLDGLGIRKGDVVAVQLPNIVEFVVAYLAIAGRGALMQTLHMPYRAAELETLLGHSGAVASVVMAQAKDYAAAELMLGLRPKLPALRHVIAVGAPPSGAHGFAEPVASGEPAPVELSGRDPFLLLYTSGTTSAPKGVPHAYQALLANARLSAQALDLGPEDVLLSAAPFTHLYGLFTCNLALATGATTLLLPAFTPPDFAALMHTAKPTAAFAAPAHVAACFAQKLFDGKDLSSLRYLQMSGSAVPPALARAFEPLMRGGKVMQLWGMTELQAGAYTRLADAEPVRAETTGGPSPGTELRVVRDDASIAAPGEEGELQVRGASVFAGYLNDPAATRAAFTPDGWFRTGDLATMDAAGNTRLAGRTKDIVNRGGVKFNPLDVETLLLGHPAVDQAAIVPMPDPVLGEKACLFVTLKPGATLTLGEVTGWLGAAQVSKVKWPERLEIVDAMPLTPTRKIMKGQLAKRLRV